MLDEVSRPQFGFFVAAGAAHLNVTVTCFTCLVFFLVSPLSYRLCESQCEGGCRLRALHVYRLHHQPTPVRQCPPAVRWLVKNCCDEKHNVLDANGTSEDLAGRRGCKM